MIPNTTPLVKPTVAIVVLLLVHVPPGVASVSVAVCPAQIPVLPVIEPGSGVTVMIFAVAQPVGSV